MRHTAFAVASLLALTTATHGQSAPPAASPAAAHATLILTGGKIWTGDPAHPEVEAVAVDGATIVAAGSDQAVMALAASGTTVVHLNGRRVLPGLNDCHVHMMVGGEDALGVHLTSARSAEEFRQRIAAYVTTLPKGKWVVNGLWDEQRWSTQELPTHALLDDITPDNPVAVSRTDLHMLVANSLAMRLAHIDRNTPDVPGGVILRDNDGNPTGIFKDAATQLIFNALPAPTVDDAINDILAMQRIAAENGVTSVQDMAVAAEDPTSPLRLRAAFELARQGRLTVRIAVAPSLNYASDLAALGMEAGFGNTWLHTGALKSFADGGLGASTAWFTEPYTDNPNNSGIASSQLRQRDKMYASFQRADRAGLQLITHAIGDRANHAILDMYEQLAKEDGPRDRRWRIEHAQTLLPADVARFAQLHVIASVQPFHAIDDGRWAAKRIGPNRILTTYAFRSLMDAGAVVCFGSDWPVAPLSPLTGIYAATTRRTIDGKNPAGWVPSEKVTVEQAVKAYTVNAAFAEGEEKIKGSLEPGKLADLVVLSDDIFHIDPAAIESTKVDLTIVNGAIVYNRKSSK